MDEYIKRETLLQEVAMQKAASKASYPRRSFVVGDVISCIRAAPAADVAPVVHGTPMLRYRPERYERYKECGLNENGEMLYLKLVLVDEKSYAMYCPACGKRLCSRFRSFCPNCGAKMDGGKHETD